MFGETKRLVLSHWRTARHLRALKRDSPITLIGALLIFALAMGGAIPTPAQQSPAGQAGPSGARAEILVLGVYHMSNPGRDIFNTKADDVLAPKRQSEIAHLVEILKKFRPTKIAVEEEVGDDRSPKAYAEYLAGKHELTRNETEQIGFRLAKALGHKTVYPTDVSAEFPFQRVQSYAKASGRSKELEALMAETGKMVKAQTQYLASHTVLETLLYMNADGKVAEDVGFYFRQAHFGEAGDWAGADLVADWFRRNMRIYSNIVQLIDSPAERVLMIYGAGHLGWLRQDFSNDPTVHLRKLAEFAN
jgi:hypothetical protein